MRKTQSYHDTKMLLLYKLRFLAMLKLMLFGKDNEENIGTGSRAITFIRQRRRLWSGSSRADP